ncbi:MAG: protein-disulfide reductase DsbD domain-containing protein, partial [Lysobacterales bacterium]
DRSLVEVTWAIAPGYYLYNNRFLQFSIQTPGVVMGKAQIPKGEVGFDDLLGEEVEKYHGELAIRLPLLSADPSVNGFKLSVRSQGCLENVLCYPPTEQVLLVGLPAAFAAPTDADSASETQALQDGLKEPGSAPLPPGPVAGLGENPLAGIGAGADKTPALDAEQAFVYEAIGLSAETILVRFTAQPGYYLYRDKFAFRVADDSGFTVRDVGLPEGVVKDDPEFGSVVVIFGQVEIPVRLSRPAGPATTISLQADFQGCRDGDICYPPQSRTVSLELPVASRAMGLPTAGDELAPATPAVATPQNEPDRLARLLGENLPKALLAFFIAGILLAFTPCVFPMVPILSGIIVGQSERLTTVRAFWLSLVYVLAMAVTYTAAGVIAGLFGQNLQAAFQNAWILSGFVLIFILLALSMFGLFELQLPASWQSRLAEVSNRRRGGEWWGVAVMGFLSALIVG